MFTLHEKRNESTAYSIRKVEDFNKMTAEVRLRLKSYFNGTEGKKHSLTLFTIGHILSSGCRERDRRGVISYISFDDKVLRKIVNKMVEEKKMKVVKKDGQENFFEFDIDKL